MATFIKEVVLEPDGPMPTYQPGDYLQFDIPAYGVHTLKELEINPPYADVWRPKDSTICGSRTPSPAVVTIPWPATPPPTRNCASTCVSPHRRGQECSAGVGSSFLFSLKPGDRITAIGPFGSFHIKPTEREMVYLGGGSGIPRCARTSRICSNPKDRWRRVSYWYGARSRQEVFYEDYFEDGAREP